MTNPLWTVVLAAGAGRRLASLTGGIPKQFWRLDGDPSLLAQTLDRFAPLAPSDRTLVVVDRRHGEYVSSLSPVQAGTVLFQPEDRGTAAGVLLALTQVLAADSDAVVALTPSDHGVIDVTTFRRGLCDATRRVRARGGIVLFGVEPTGADDDYGWITPAASPGSSAFRPVVSFVEKPSADAAERLSASGAVWNTMVIVARASALHGLYVRHLPELAEVFDEAARLPCAERDAFLAAVYPGLPTFDFSGDLLTPASDLTAYVWPASIGWSDLGTPERLRGWLARTEAVRAGHAIAAA